MAGELTGQAVQEGTDRDRVERREPCASSEPQTPDSTSPLPAVPSHGVAVVLTARAPVGVGDDGASSP